MCDIILISNSKSKIRKINKKIKSTVFNSNIQERLVDIWKENILKDLEIEKLEFILVSDFLIELKIKFSREDNKLAKVVKLKRVEQKTRIIEKFMQKFRRIAKNNKYKQILVKKFKREMNNIIKKKVIEVKFF